jgi:hypothetical protein
MVREVLEIGQDALQLEEGDDGPDPVEIYDYFEVEEAAPPEVYEYFEMDPPELAVDALEVEEEDYDDDLFDDVQEGGASHSCIPRFVRWLRRCLLW